MRCFSDSGHTCAAPRLRSLMSLPARLCSHSACRESMDAPRLHSHRTRTCAATAYGLRALPCLRRASPGRRLGATSTRVNGHPWGRPRAPTSNSAHAPYHDRPRIPAAAQRTGRRTSEHARTRARARAHTHTRRGAARLPTAIKRGCVTRRPLPHSTVETRPASVPHHHTNPAGDRHTTRHYVGKQHPSQRPHSPPTRPHPLRDAMYSAGNGVAIAPSAAPHPHWGVGRGAASSSPPSSASNFASPRSSGR